MLGGEVGEGQAGQLLASDIEAGDPDQRPRPRLRPVASGSTSSVAADVG